MLTISLEELRFYAPVGLYPEEQCLRNEFLVAVHLQLEEGPGPVAELGDTIDYSEVYHLIKAQMERPCLLMETVAERCLQNIKGRWPRLCAAEIVLRKLHPPLPGEVGCSKITLSKRYPADAATPESGTAAAAE